MKIDFARHQEQFLNDGLTIIKSYLDKEFCKQIVTKVLSFDSSQIRLLNQVTDFDIEQPLAIRHKFMDGVDIAKNLGEVAGIYNTLPAIISAVIGEEVIIGGWQESDVNLLVYNNESLKGPHVDTVPISVVMPLTTIDPKSGVFYYTDLNGKAHEYDPEAGDLLIFKGREVHHGVRINNMNKLRVIINANYYLPNDHHREESGYIDEVLY